MKRRITVERNTLRFSAAHFTTFAGECEPLHGHNYDVLVEVEGELTEDAWVFDFVELKKIVAAICKELDHKLILQRDSRVLSIDEGDTNWKVRLGQRGWVFPKDDVIALPIDNSTAERLAEWVCDRLEERLRAAGALNLSAISVGIEEAPGQAGWYRRDLAPR